MTMTRRSKHGLASVLVATLLSFSCDSGGFVSPDPTTPPRPASIQIDSIPLQLARDDTLALHATVLSESGSSIAGLNVDWSTSDGNVATVTATTGTGALLVARDQGTASITASYETLTATKSIKVHRRPADLVYVSGSGQTGDAGQTLPANLLVRVVDRRGDAVPDVDVSFVVVSGGGSVSPGNGLTDANGQTGTTWTLGSAIQQQVEARASEAQQSIQQLKDSVVVFTASTATLARLAINLDSVDFTALGDTVVASATGYASNDSVMPLPDITWSSSDTTVATVSATGIIRGRRNGRTKVRAAAEGMADTLNVRVQQVPVLVSVLPKADTLTAVGDTGYLQATAYDSRGNVVPDAPFDWNSTDSSVVEVNSMGRLMAMAAGTALVIVNTASCSDSAGVTVQTQAVADTTTPVISDTTPPAAPSGLSLAATWTDSTHFTLTASWQSVPDAALYGWTTSSNSGSWNSQDTTSNVNMAVSVPLSSAGSGYWLCVASVDTAGNTSADSACGSYTAPTDPIAPDTASVATVQVNPPSASTFVGGQVQLSVTLLDGSGAVVTGRSVSWTSSNSAVATVSSTGLVTGVALGSANIVATSGGVSGQATLQVVEQQTGTLAEPVYDATKDALILRDDFNSYANWSQAEAAYPVGRNTNYGSLVTGRGGTGNAVRLHYGSPGGASDILFGTESQLNAVGKWNGTLPQVAGPYTHFLFTTWFRYNGADPDGGGSSTSGIKGFMFWNTSGRYEFAANQLAQPGGTRMFKVFNPDNAQSGLSVWKTADGMAPLWSDYNDNTWHRFTVEIYAGNDPSGHRGARAWVDGTEIYDDVDVDVVTGQSPYEGYTYSSPITHWFVWGNFSIGISDPFTIDFDDWIAWTDNR